MARRIVTHSRQHAGRIIAVGNPTEWWSPRSATDVAVDIDAEVHTYWARDADGRIHRIAIADGRAGVHARISPNEDILAVLPEC